MKVRERILAGAGGTGDEFRRLHAAGFLPFPEFANYVNESSIEFVPKRSAGGVLEWQFKLHDCGSEWKCAMLNQAGQIVRSHLAKVRSREGERFLQLTRKALFEHGGYVCTKKRGKRIPDAKLTVEDIALTGIDTAWEAYEQRPAYGSRKWFTTFRGYEKDVMPVQQLDVELQSRREPRIRSRMLKGWSKIRKSWRREVAKDVQTPAAKLMNIVDKEAQTVSRGRWRPKTLRLAGGVLPPVSVGWVAGRRGQRWRPRRPRLSSRLRRVQPEIL